MGTGAAEVLITGMARTNVPFETQDIPAIIEALEDSLDILCGEPDCEDCTIRSVVIASAIETLFKKAKKVEVVF